MSQENILKILAGTSAVVRNSSKMMEQKIAETMEDKVFKGKYVTHEEYEKLKKLVGKMQEQILEIKQTDSNK